MASDTRANHAPRIKPALGSLGWAWDEFFTGLKNWREARTKTFAFVFGAALVVIAMALFKFPGGVLPAIPVLTMPLVPHSVRLLVTRVIVVSIAMLLTYVVYTTLQEQPWIILLIAMSSAYFGLYLVGKGLDMLYYLLVVATPILIGWEAALGADVGAAVWQGYQQILPGLLITGLLGIVFLQPQTAKALRHALASSLDAVADSLVDTTQFDSASSPRMTVDSLTEIETLLARLRAEKGRTIRARNVHVVADTVRMIIGWNDTRRQLHEIHLKAHDDALLEEFSHGARKLLTAQLSENASALREHRDARPIPGLDEANDRFTKACLEGVANGTIAGTLERRASCHAFAAIYEYAIEILRPMTTAISTKWHEPPENIPLPSREHRRPWSPLKSLVEALSTPNKAASLFATKGVIIGIISFTLATVFSDWHGAPVLLLMALLLAPQSLGSIANGYVLRMVGLAAAVVICLAAVLVILPDLDDPWTYGLLLAGCLLPGAIVAQTPQMVPFGLGYCMSVFFILTQPDAPSVDLSPIQDRIVSVAGATTIAWLVFLFVRPVYARERIGDELAKACSAIGDTLRLSAAGPSRHVRAAEESEVRWATWEALDRYSKTINASKAEFNAQKEHSQVLTEILGELEQMFSIGRYEMRIRIWLGARVEFNAHVELLDHAVAAYADAIEALGHAALRNSNPRPAIEKAGAELRKTADAIEGTSLEEGIEEHYTMAKFAGLVLMKRMCEQMLELLKMRQVCMAREKPFAIGGAPE